MVFKAAVTFIYNPNNVPQGRQPLSRFEDYLAFHKLPFSRVESRHAHSRTPFADETLVECTFRIEREIDHESSACYLSMIIQGEAGLMKLNPYVLSVNVDLLDQVHS